jgi:hypothetical protein
MRSKPVTAAVQEIEKPQTPASPGDQAGLADDLQHLRDLLEKGDVEGARAWVRGLEKRWPESERVRHYAHVLAPPKARVRSDVKGRPLDREWEWLRQHGHEYPGCWLAVFEDQLVAADPDYHLVVAQTREKMGDESALIVRQPDGPEPR